MSIIKQNIFGTFYAIQPSENNLNHKSDNKRNPRFFDQPKHADFICQLKDNAKTDVQKIAFKKST